MFTAHELQAILPLWTSHLWKRHKFVHAGQITAVVLSGTSVTLRLRAADDSEVAVPIESAVTSRYRPTLGDYLVVYNDGHVFVASRRGFEAGYERVWPEPPASGAAPSEADRSVEPLPMWQTQG